MKAPKTKSAYEFKNGWSIKFDQAVTGSYESLTAVTYQNGKLYSNHEAMNADEARVLLEKIKGYMGGGDVGETFSETLTETHEKRTERGIGTGKTSEGNTTTESMLNDVSNDAISENNEEESGCALEIHKELKSKMGRCSGPLLIARNTRPYFKGNSDVIRCKKHAENVNEINPNIKFEIMESTTARTRRAACS